MGTRVFQTVMKFHCQGGSITRENDENDGVREREVFERRRRKKHTRTHLINV